MAPASVPDTAAAFKVRDVALPQELLAGGGAGILNELEVKDKDPEVNRIEAPVTDVLFDAVNPENVATPEDALIVFVPPSVHVPDEPTAAVTEAELPVSVLLY